MEHTPTPWHIGGTGSVKAPAKNGETVRVWAADTGAICELSTRRSLGDSSNPTERANAAFIVRACNTHDELVAALQKLLKAHDKRESWFSEDLWNEARAALAKVQPAPSSSHWLFTAPDSTPVPPVAP